MKKHCLTTIFLILILFSSSCSKKDKQQNKNENIELHSVSYEHVVAPSGSYSTAQIFVKKSVPVMLGMEVDVIIEALDDAKIKTEFIEEILIKLPSKYIIAASGVTGYVNPDRIKTKKLGKLLLCQDDKALSTDEDLLYAPRVSLIANWEANLAVELLLREKK